ncbi:MAG: aminotransferase class I/II-fold pyridoxal phosphate-dependent enzyme [Ruminococcaceae bacterium]|nr:aminotransferase class I/II-fold pyridoxal phosphate-dependent enzyme [Oscillospiraceae bacterium]
MLYCQMTQEELKSKLITEKKIYDEYKSKNYKLDMTRGKPAPDQLQLSMDMLHDKYIGDGKSSTGVDYKNYGIVDGIPEAKKFFGEILNLPCEQIFVSGNSSLNIMHDILVRFILLGTSEDSTPWKDQGKLKFLCPVPGYDRHFAITELFGFEMINIPILEDGPDMDLIENLVANDSSIKGMWCIPKYSNPTGTVFSDDVIRRLASMKTASDDFRIFCDDAYTVHYLKDAPAKQLNLITACTDAGNPDRALMFTSTSKITFPGAGISAFASSVKTVKYLTKLINLQTIGSDKLNQLRHVNFLKNYDGVLAQMKKHAELLRPKFQICLDIFERDIKEFGILEWTKPEGGYFISIDTMEGCASRVVELAKECGVALTPAGSTYPYKKDPDNKNIRLAPSFPTIDQLEKAMEILCVCIKIASLEKLIK